MMFTIKMDLPQVIMVDDYHEVDVLNSVFKELGLPLTAKELVNKEGTLEYKAGLYMVQIDKK